MYSKGFVLIFLILGLSSSVAHAIRHENRAPEPCEDTPHKTQPVLTPSPSPSKAPKDKKKGGDNSLAKTVTGNKNDTAPTGGKNDTSVTDGKNDTAATGGNNDPKTSLCLDKTVLSTGSESDGLKNATNGTSASLTSTNNFINFCVNKQVTNGQQLKDGSCNSIPMGDIPSSSNIPSSKFVTPQNLDILKAKTTFTMKLAVKGAQLGNFVNAETNYYGAPQQLNKQGEITGHTHMVIEQIASLKATDPTDPLKFTFFKGVNDALGADGTVSVPVPGGLPVGTFRFGTIGTSANHAPWLAPVAQHGIMEDAIYVTVTEDGSGDGSAATGNTTDTGKKNKNSTAGNTNTNATTTPSATSSQSTATPSATGNKTTTKGGKGGKKLPRAFSLEYRKD